ncbi:MAG TPA: hypothetical protein VK735_40070 [Pseudonocardia sp.]|uniref:hypothetical protein n=1 Tax=Pseudonocardia sp. TaxID=60912 RepID=UPI002C0473B4|nr:hypothetical protein [Pseudonocardia sp.]HTF53682.1 hypothetical protein [Pseudonocardia sp.]
MSKLIPVTGALALAPLFLAQVDPGAAILCALVAMVLAVTIMLRDGLANGWTVQGRAVYTRPYMGGFLLGFVAVGTMTTAL